MEKENLRKRFEDLEPGLMEFGAKEIEGIHRWTSPNNSEFTWELIFRVKKVNNDDE